ncbi:MULTISPECIES: hypothetical protein [Neisseria]|uniref:hypothetical protein n=1 Tax=Neisseria TaxID=482 RepID=UPI0006CE744A|nr:MULTISPECIES: hypothetical protein [Neisseria]KPN71843.1 membrane protein [Neisseria sp. 83E34]
MWHIIAIGYIFTTMMFSLAQPGIARKLIYLFFWTILPTLFMFWVVMTRRRNKRLNKEMNKKDKSLPD